MIENLQQFIDTLKAQLAAARDQLQQAQDALGCQGEEMENILAELEKAGWRGPASPGVEWLRAERDEAQEKLKPYAFGPSGEPFFKTKADAERALEQVEREYDAAIERAEAAEAVAKKRLNCGLAVLDILRVVLDSGVTTVMVGRNEWRGFGTARVLTPAEAQARQKEGDGG